MARVGLRGWYEATLLTVLFFTGAVHAQGGSCGSAGELGEHGDLGVSSAIDRKSRLKDALCKCCGPYGLGGQHDICVRQGETVQEHSLRLARPALIATRNYLAAWQERMWGDAGKADAIDLNLQVRADTLLWALRRRDLDAVQDCWKGLTLEDQQSFGCTLIEDEIDRWQLLVRLKRHSRSGSDDAHCFGIALGLLFLPSSHPEHQHAEELCAADGRSKDEILAVAREPMVREATCESIEVACRGKKPKERAMGIVVASGGTFDENSRVPAVGVMCSMGIEPKPPFFGSDSNGVLRPCDID